jgi:hypothetical protein
MGEGEGGRDAALAAGGHRSRRSLVQADALDQPIRVRRGDRERGITIDQHRRQSADRQHQADRSDLAQLRPRVNSASAHQWHSPPAQGSAHRRSRGALTPPGGWRVTTRKDAPSIREIDYIGLPNFNARLRGLGRPPHLDEHSPDDRADAPDAHKSAELAGSSAISKETTPTNAVIARGRRRRSNLDRRCARRPEIASLRSQ